MIQRGNNREYIFEKSEDKMFLLNEIKERTTNTGLKLYGYVIMDNHYHLVLQVEDVPLSKLMHFINSSYGRYYNREHIDIDLLLGILSNDREKAIMHYTSFMDQEDSTDYECGEVIGDKSFMTSIIPPKQEIVKKSLDEILTDTGVCSYKSIGENINLSAAAISKLLSGVD